MKVISIFVSISILILGLLCLKPGRALAHGHAEVGDYELVIGFHTEPAYQGEPNGLDLFVTDTRTGEPVNGLDETLRAEIIFGSSRRELELRPQFGQEGAYTADLLPTEAGDYTWRIFGTIAGTPVDLSMTSGPDTFNPVQLKAAVSFPSSEPALLEVSGQSQAAARTARIALAAGAAGALLGAAGLVAGLLSLRTNPRNNL